MSAQVIRDRDHVNQTLEAACERLRQAADRARLLQAGGFIVAQTPPLIELIWRIKADEHRTDADPARLIAQLESWLVTLDGMRPHELLAKHWPLEGVIGEIEAARGLLRVAQCDIACPVQDQ